MTWFGVERSKINVRIRVNSNMAGFELYECLLVG